MKKETVAQFGWLLFRRLLSVLWLWPSHPSACRSDPSTKAASPLWVGNGGLQEGWRWTNWDVPSSGTTALKAWEEKRWTERRRSAGGGWSRTWKTATCHWYVSQSDRLGWNLFSFICNMSHGIVQRTTHKQGWMNEWTTGLKTQYWSNT